MKNKKILGIFGLAATALVGATFAFFNQTESIDNIFRTSKYEVNVTEDFIPKKDWKPGEEVDKDLFVKNEGDRAVVVRVKFEDIWTRDGEKDAFHVAAGMDATTVFQIDPYDGKTADPQNPEKKDKSVVIKKFAAGVKENWSEVQPDGWFYYKTTLGAGEETGKFLDAVELSPDTDFGKLMTQFYYTTAATLSEAQWEPYGEAQPASLAQIAPLEGWTYTRAETQAEDGALGYSNADYVLRITIQTVQATEDAVANVFATVPDEIAAGWRLDSEVSN